jgi:putative nucleotidyltransferase with HDIG domain
MQTILLIDSCPLVRECLSTILRAKGYRVQNASQVGQAKTMIVKKVPDLILTEIRLPDDNALNLLRWIKSEPTASKIKVCLLTNAAAKKPIMEAVELGVNKVMLKPKFTIAGFLTQVAQLTAPPAPTDKSDQASPESNEDHPTYLLPEPAQDPALALKAIKPIIARTLLNERIEALGELHTLSEPIARVLQAIDDPDTTIEMLADLIKLDQTIAMKIMRVANSSNYARAEQTTTLKDAVLKIGLEPLRELIIAVGIVDRMRENQTEAQGFDHQLFWEHALGVAACASKIAQVCQGMNPEMIFTAAILHDIGRVILLQALPEFYPKVLKQSHTLGVPLEHTEKRLLLADHTTIAQNVLGTWNLPKDLIDAIVHHHCVPSKLASVCPKNTELAGAIELADRLTHAMGIGCSGNKTISGTEELFDLLGSSELTLESITDGLDDTIESMRALIFPPNQASRRIVKPNAPALDRVFHPVYLTMDPKTDAIGHWVMSHHDHPNDEKVESNIAIVHARQAKDRQALADQLELAQTQLDEAAGSTASPLPVLILSPTGKIGLPEEILTRHPTVHLMTPFSVLHFEQQVNHLLNGLVRPQENWTQRKSA